MPATWADVAAADPEFAARVRSCFAANLHHVLGTIRPDGAPRLSGTEVTIDDEHVRLGMMADSLKLRDVTRDPRVEIHSAPLDVELRVGDAKLVGRAVATGPTPEDGPPGSTFVVALDAVSLVRVEGEELVLSVWTPARGLHQIRRH